MKKIIKNAKVVLEDGIIWDGALIIEDGIILEVGNAYDVEIPKDAEVIDANGAYVGPGFVDLHVHGALDARLFFKPEEIGKHFLKHGETSIFPTSSNSFAYEQLLEGIRNIKAAMGKVKNFKGIYMEGPYINPNYGAARLLDTWNKGPIDEKQYIPLVDELGTVVKVWGIAPEREGLMPFLEYARKVNPDVVFSVCHSEAMPEQVRNLGTKFQPKLITHMMNATGRQTGSGGVRGYGPDEYCMADPDMYAELISDEFGLHVHSDLQRMIVKNKGVHRVVLVTDSTPYKYGTTPEKYAHLGEPDVNFSVRGGLSGSKLTMDKACRNIMTHTNCGIAQAFVMASLNPAKVVGMDDKIGSIKPGKVADLVFVDDMFNVEKVILDGEVCEF